MTGYETIPPAIRRGLDAYATEGLPTGDFLRAVLSNDLRMAVGRADENSLAALGPIVRYCHWELPGRCWGSPQAVDEWLKAKAEAAGRAE